MLTRENFIGPWAGLPVAWTSDNKVDEPVYRADVARCCKAGAAGVYTGGTSGEFYAMELDDFQAVARATVEECRAAGTPSMIGCTSTSTLGAIRRATFAAEIGADAIQLALPFWLEVPDDQVVPFFKDVASAIDRTIAISVYETARAKKTLTLEQHRAIKDAVPNYLMVKANENTIGCTPDGCRTLSAFVNVFVSENLFGSLGRLGAVGSCSSIVYYNPRVMLTLWNNLREKNWEAVDADCRRLDGLFDFYGKQFGHRGLADSALDRLGGTASGFLKTSLQARGPYPSATPDDVRALQAWYREHFPEMLTL